MACSKFISIVIDTAIPYVLPVPYVATGDGEDKETTVFVMADEEHSLAIAGTFDKIVSFASGIISAMYSWPVHTGHEAWLGDPYVPDPEGTEVYVIRKRS